MSSLKVHAAQSVVTSAALYPFMGENVIPFGLAVVLIDLDHVIEYVRDTRSLDVRGVFPCCKLIETNLDKRFLVINCFHTIEFFALILLLSTLVPALIFVLGGMIYHLAFDLVHLFRIGQPFARAYSIFEYLYRAKKPECVISVKELIGRENLNIAKVRDFSYWASKWGANDGGHT